MIAAHCHQMGNCNNGVDCGCSCGPCNTAARHQLLKDLGDWKKKLDDLTTEYGKALKP
jgi:bacterioferritin-associated ferredoxin